jgi:hypothetical protein
MSIIKERSERALGPALGLVKLLVREQIPDVPGKHTIEGRTLEVTRTHCSRNLRNRRG